MPRPLVASGSPLVPIPDVSVVVCTYKRPQQLRRALASLAAQTLERARYEVVVVDNGGGLEELALDAGADEVLYEPVPGASRARNAGWRHTTSELVGFLDDDAVAESDWLEQALDLYTRSVLTPVAFGGPILPLWEAPRPAWFKEEYELRTWGAGERALERGESLSASNLFFVREMLERLGGFDTRLGPVGGRVGLAEETVLFEHLSTFEPFPPMVYSPRLVVRHSVPPRNMTARYQLRRFAVYGESLIVRQGLTLRDRLRLLPPTLRQLAALLPGALRRLRRPLRQWAVEELREPAIRVGMLRAAIRDR
jgi:glycosyltransferase involved in cell wall biosynthesis